MDKPPNITVGAVVFESTGDEIVIRSAKHEDVFVVVPARSLEAWGLRKLREDAFQPETKTES